jgi:phosphatidylinositol alpha-mannosyltransferase
MKIAIVSPYDLAAPGGVQDQVENLVGWLGRQGLEAWAVAPGSGGPPGTRHVGPAVSVPANRSRAPIALDPRVSGRLRAAVADADVIHVHEPLMPVVSLAALRITGPPLVGTFHAAPGSVIRAVYRLGAPLLRRLTDRLAVVTAVSPTARDAVAGFTEARIVPNAVDVDAFRSARTDFDASRVLFIGRDEPRKGLDVLLHAWPMVRARRPGATLRVVGTARPSGPAGTVFLGRVDEDTKRRELASAGVLCAPNLGGESFGIVLTEAMAAGCAVVASDLPAFRDVAGAGAILVPPGNPGTLADVLGRVVADDDLAGQLAEAGGRAVMRFDRSGVVAAYLDGYREALEHGPPVDR